MTAITWPAPVVGADSRPFWDFAQARELRMQRCAACSYLRWPPGPVCPRCWSPDAEWEELSGRGVLQSWVVYRRQYDEAFPVPFTVGLVELDEGPRMEALLTGLEPHDARWRMPVEVVWEERAGFVLPCFTPSDDEGRSAT